MDPLYLSTDDESYVQARVDEEEWLQWESVRNIPLSPTTASELDNLEAARIMDEDDSDSYYWAKLQAENADDRCHCREDYGPRTDCDNIEVMHLNPCCYMAPDKDDWPCYIMCLKVLPCSRCMRLIDIQLADEESAMHEAFCPRPTVTEVDLQEADRQFAEECEKSEREEYLALEPGKYGPDYDKECYCAYINPLAAEAGFHPDMRCPFHLLV